MCFDGEFHRQLVHDFLRETINNEGDGRFTDVSAQAGVQVTNSATDVPLASRVGIQCANSSSGVRKIAPPVPVSPDSVPIAPPA